MRIRLIVFATAVLLICESVHSFDNESEATDRDFYLVLKFQAEPSTETTSPESVADLQPIPGHCLITKNPKNGWIEYNDPPTDRIPIGGNVENFTKIKYKCNKNHLITTSDTNICKNDTWVNEIPICEPRCSGDDIKGQSLIAWQCSLPNSTSVSCDEPALPGTMAEIYCKDMYDLPGARRQNLRCQQNGNWSSVPQPCSAICGEEAPKHTPHLVAEADALGDMVRIPWHVGIYKDDAKGVKKLRCGGTILSENTVVSAMHCFWDRTIQDPYPASMFTVTAGKTKSDFNAEEVLRVQYFDVEKFTFPADYMDFDGYYFADIGLVTLKGSIVLRPHVAPICVEYGLDNDSEDDMSGSIGMLSGWGPTKPGLELSPDLNVIGLPIIERNMCIEESDKSFRPFITKDKFCAGYKDLNIGVCPGDAGGGLVFPKTINERKKFFLRGIVSVGPSKDGFCDVNRYTAFTNVSHYLDLLQ